MSGPDSTPTLAPSARADQTLDSIVGRLLFRFLGGLLSVVAATIAWAGISHLTAATAPTNWAFGVILLVMAMALARFVVWCFAPVRRLAEFVPF